MNYKFISWNIDSLNAALTGTSDRAALSVEVIQKIVKFDADIVALQETKLNNDANKLKKLIEKLHIFFQIMKLFTIIVRHRLEWDMQVQCFFIKKHYLNPSLLCPRLVPLPIR